MARRSQQELPPPILMKRSLLRREGSDVLGIKEEEEEDKRKKAKRKTSRAKTKAKPPKFLESRHWEKTKYLGVQQHKGTGEYRTVVRGKTFGCYATCTEAATQYDEIALRLDADAPTNFPARGLPLYAAPLPPSWLGDDAKSSEDLKAPKNKKRRHHPPRATGAPKTTDDEPPSSSDARQDDDDGEEDDEAILVHSDDEAYRP
mmetsp:Transcript_15088/g.49165  ORF Transcript_15088/g.49165 Transcript_15088/m.49165 type:complete len:203 (-) Transcript_15088:333-941(-)